MNNTALNACVQISVSTAVLSVLGCIPKSRVAGSRGNSMLTVRNCQPVFPKQLHHFISILHAKAYNNYLLARRKKFLHWMLLLPALRGLEERGSGAQALGRITQLVSCRARIGTQRRDSGANTAVGPAVKQAAASRRSHVIQVVSGRQSRKGLILGPGRGLRNPIKSDAEVYLRSLPPPFFPSELLQWL